MISNSLVTESLIAAALVFGGIGFVGRYLDKHIDERSEWEEEEK